MSVLTVLTLSLEAILCDGLPAHDSRMTEQPFVKRQVPIEDDTQHLHVLSHWKINTGDGYSTPAMDTDDADESMTQLITSANK